MRGGLFCLMLLICTLEARAQYNVTISGYVKDGASSEVLPGAGVRIRETSAGTAANSYGFFSLQAPADKDITLSVYKIGYKVQLYSLRLKRDTFFNFFLNEDIATTEIEVKSDDLRQELGQTQMGRVEVSISQIKQLPAIFGEVDVLKTLQLIPGVQSGTEGSTGFYVRGGGPDQNLLLLDEATVYNASHLFGFFSVFNSDAVRNVELYKGGFPAQYGGRLSSVVDVSLKDGNMKKFSGSGGIGLIASRLTLEVPVIKDTCSVIVSGRRTYLDVFTRAINAANKKNENWTPIPSYYFYDLNTKVNYILGAKDRLYLSGYFGRDVFGADLNGDFDFGFRWGNATTTARWNHLYSNKLFSNLTAIFTDYNYKIEGSAAGAKFGLGSSIRDYGLKYDFSYQPVNAHTVRFGASYIYHTFGVGNAQFSGGTGDSSTSIDINFDSKKYGSELGLYINDDWDINERLRLTAGLRGSGFVNNKVAYPGIEPRLATRYKVNEDVSLKASYTAMNQYVQLVSNSGASLPTDIWYPSTEIVKPQFAQQVAAGTTAMLFKDYVSLTYELFYKWMKNQIDFKDGANLFLNNNLDKEFVFGRGYSYGSELLLQRKSGRFTGWLGYTLSWTWRQFDSINNGEPYLPKYDQRHYVTFAGSYDVSKRVTLSANFVYGTGNMTTLPVAFAITNDIEGNNPDIIPIVDKRSNTRMNPYMRLDLAVIIKFEPRWGHSDLNISVFNALNRRNPFFAYIDYQTQGNGAVLIPVNVKAKQVSLFPIIPSITYNFTF